MSLKTPFWWYAKDHQLIAKLLTPISALYGLAVRLRWAVTSARSVRIPVLCIGNFTAGGGGKTPAAIALAELLKRRGEKPVFLSRGYGGALRGPHKVSAHRDHARDVGDEPLLLARHAPTVIAKNRVLGALFIEQTLMPLGEASVIIMDDGFQNPTLMKTLSLLVVDGLAGIGNGRVIPGGPLRAPMAFQLERASGLLKIDQDLSASQKDLGFHVPETIPLFRALLKADVDINWLRDTPVVAFTGIAHPEKFFATLEGLGARLEEKMSYPDHHFFNDSEAQALLQLSRQNECTLVTTEKDFTRLFPQGSDGAHDNIDLLRQSVRTVPVRLIFTEQETQGLLAWLATLKK